MRQITKQDILKDNYPIVIVNRGKRYNLNIEANVLLQTGLTEKNVDRCKLLIIENDIASIHDEVLVEDINIVDVNTNGRCDAACRPARPP